MSIYSICIYIYTYIEYIEYIYIYVSMYVHDRDGVRKRREWVCLLYTAHALCTRPCPYPTTHRT